jgi:hypothetical protein
VVGAAVFDDETGLERDLLRDAAGEYLDEVWPKSMP